MIEREGRHQIDVAKGTGLQQSTVQQIYSQRVKITQSFSQFGLASKRSKPSTFPEIDDALTKWFDAARAQNLSLNGPVVLEKAKEIWDVSHLTVSIHSKDKFLYFMPF